MKRTQQILYCLFSIIGLICIFFPSHITALLPYLLGGTMLAAGALRIVLYARAKSRSAQNSSEFATGLVLAVVGIMFLIKGENALGAMGTVWAIIGIRKAAQSLDQAIRLIQEKQRFLLPALTFLVRMTLALILLFNPFEKFASHIVILGFELIATSVRFTGNHSTSE